jgi:hypothetical protein
MRHRVVLDDPRAEHWTMPLALLALASGLDRGRLQPVIVDGRLAQAPGSAALDHCGGALLLGRTVYPENVRRLVQPFTLGSSSC